MRTLWLTILSLAFAAPLWAVQLPQTAAVPGGVVILNLGPAHSPAPQAFYGKRQVMVLRNEQDWLAVVGIPLGAKVGAHELRVENGKQKRKIAFNVSDKKYREQHLTITNKRKVNPNAEDMKRIRKEQKRIRAALRQFSVRDEVNMAFLAPVDGPRSSSFGLRRFFNKQARKPHSGMDIAAPTGTPIIAPAGGDVIETGDYFFNGRTVFVDHGQGLVTMFCHMDRIDVKPGQRVKAGEILGTVGMTGRVTGAHLHFGVSLNNARVDPALFLPPVKTN